MYAGFGSMGPVYLCIWPRTRWNTYTTFHHDIRIFND